MLCPYCEYEDTKVVDSRPTVDRSVRRRRVCEKCGKRFTTYERVESSILMVIKKDGSRQVFDRAKVIGGIVRACEKRPITIERIEEMVDRIERGLGNMMEKEVPSHFIGQLIMDQLRDVDQVAYVRFASVYRQFTDVQTFIQEIEKLTKPPVESEIK